MITRKLEPGDVVWELIPDWENKTGYQPKRRKIKEVVIRKTARKETREYIGEMGNQYLRHEALFETKEECKPDIGKKEEFRQKLIEYVEHTKKVISHRKASLTREEKRIKTLTAIIKKEKKDASNMRVVRKGVRGRKG